MADEETTEEALPEGDTFPRAYVEKLRDEAARYRVELRPFKDAFGDFSDAEKTYLFGMLTALNTDPTEGALQFRDMSKNILKDKFYTDLDDLPEKEKDESETTMPEQTTPAGLTKDELQQLLDEREVASKQEADVEAVFAEVEALGFERGSEGFMTMLSLANAKVQSGQEADFSKLAPIARTAAGLPEPDAEAGAEEPEAKEPEAPRHPTTPEAGGAGKVVESPKDWVAEAKAEGKNPMEVARLRMEQRFETAG